jgi:hypothetical protein
LKVKIDINLQIINNFKNLRMKKTVLLFVFGLLITIHANSKEETDSTTLSVGDKIDKWQTKLPLNFSGSVDAYVQTNFIPKQTNTVLNEAFPTKANSFELGMINFMLSKEIKKIGFMADIGFGPRAEAANNTLYANSIIAIKQLYMSYAPADWVKFTLGNFSTFFGYELIEPQNNFHYSTSLAFQNGPFYHTGLKANFTKGKFNFLTGFFNDTDTKSDNDRNKYAGAQVGYTGDKVSGYLNWVGGNETNAHDTLSPFKNYKSSLGFTGLATLGKESKGSMALDFAWHRFRQKLAKGDDASSVQYFTTYLYGKYNLKDNVGLGLRLGYANNNDYAMPYVAGAAKNFVDVTLTSSITISDFLIVKPEFRLDYADEKVFLDRKGNGSNLQYRLLMATIFTF